MESSKTTLFGRRLAPAITILMFALLISAVGCGDGEAEDDSFPKISDPGVVLTLQDLLATPYKESSNYSTENLPGATDVSFGFLRVGNGDPYDYEMRFYESHQDAIDLGTAMADEGTGPDAILSDDDATYAAGIKNRRMIIGGGAGGGARSGIGPKFADYAIFGNVIMLCQGSDPEISLDRCKLMANALVPVE